MRVTGDVVLGGQCEAVFVGSEKRWVGLLVIKVGGGGAKRLLKR